MDADCPVRDAVIWIKHVESDAFRARLEALASEEEIAMAVDGVEGRWARMRTGQDGRRVNGLRPVGRTKAHWPEIYDNRRGTTVRLSLIERPSASPAPTGQPDAWTASIDGLMPEWLSEADEEAFRDL